MLILAVVFTRIEIFEYKTRTINKNPYLSKYKSQNNLNVLFLNYMTLSRNVKIKRLTAEHNETSYLNGFKQSFFSTFNQSPTFRAIHRPFFWITFVKKNKSKQLLMIQTRKYSRRDIYFRTNIQISQ